MPAVSRTFSLPQAPDAMRALAAGGLAGNAAVVVC